MSTVKHTPGPWDSNITQSGYLCVFKKWPSKQYPDNNNVFEMQTIAVIRPFKDLTEYDMPNGKLLAAAPEMYELLTEYFSLMKKSDEVNHFDHLLQERKWNERAQSVIAKATT